MNPVKRPFILGVGGTTRAGSSTERVLRAALRAAEQEGAETCLLSGPDIDLPNYAPERAAETLASLRLVSLARRADGLILASPGYHGSLSGLVKNALDYLEGLRDDERPYLDGRAVGCISVAAGWQAAVGTLTALRSVVHALRGWPTPLGVPINSVECAVGPDGECSDRRIAEQLAIVGRQTVEFSTLRRAANERGASERGWSNPSSQRPAFIPRQINWETVDDFG